MSKIGKSIETKNKIMFARGWGKMESGSYYMGMGFIFEKIKMFWN